MTVGSEAPINTDMTRARLAKGMVDGDSDFTIPDNPSLATLGTVVNEATKGRVRVTFTAGAGNVQGNGVVGGGTFANMIDSAMALSVMTLLDKGTICSTVSLTVNMMRSGLPGAFTAVAKVDKIGRRIAFAAAELADAQGRVVATATSSLAIIET
ncbi:PaaI family thioesterase [Seohaeicola zhoushanensis]|uniref:Thioesterase domain-containing protein n=1 Tax=Seohaeicola zhoushanensis TaxID=1569283 RepID=A0A8J3H1E5_9RHOB|nr:PaaI family thioesterase [Seohaeicola zhoushanensis]GHF72167.1 hypothetical protein GCM10017056_48910 [Seohaeicola zhoushanensis]